MWQEAILTYLWFHLFSILELKPTFRRVETGVLRGTRKQNREVVAQPVRIQLWKFKHTVSLNSKRLSRFYKFWLSLAVCETCYDTIQEVRLRICENKQLKWTASFFLSNFNKISFFLTNFIKTVQQKVLRKSDQRELSCYRKTDRQTLIKVIVVISRVWEEASEWLSLMELVCFTVSHASCTVQYSTVRIRHPLQNRHNTTVWTDSRQEVEIKQIAYFRCYTVHVVELLNYYTNYCTYIKFTHATKNRMHIRSRALFAT